MQDLTLDFTNKTINNTFLKGKDLIVQQVILALQCWTGDWFLDGSYGIDYENRLRSQGLLLADMEDIILSVDGVKSVQDIDLRIGYEGERFTQKVIYISASLVLTTSDQITLSNIPIVNR